MARSLVTSLSKSIINNIRLSRPSFLLEFRQYNSSSIISSFDHSKKDNVKTSVLEFLTELRDNDIPKLGGRITSVLNVTKECIQPTKFNIALKNAQILLPNDIDKLKTDLNELILSLETIPAENFESNKMDTTFFSEKIDRQYTDKLTMNNMFHSLTNVIDDLWMTKRSKMKRRTIVNDLQSLLSHLQDENIDLKLSVSHLQDENTLYKYHSCVSELMRYTVRSIKKEFRKKLKMEYISENFDKDVFESLLVDPQHKEIKDILNLDDKQISVMLAIFDTICSKYGFRNKHILSHYLLLVSIRNEREHDRMDSYIKSTSDDRRSFQMYCEKNYLIQHYEQKHCDLLEGLFKLYAIELIRKLKEQEHSAEAITES